VNLAAKAPRPDLSFAQSAPAPLDDLGINAHAWQNIAGLLIVDRDLSRQAAAIVPWLRQHADPDGTGIRVGKRRLAKLAYIGEKSVTPACSELAERGLLCETERGNGTAAAQRELRATQDLIEWYEARTDLDRRHRANNGRGVSGVVTNPASTSASGVRRRASGVETATSGVELDPKPRDHETMTKRGRQRGDYASRRDYLDADATLELLDIERDSPKLDADEVATHFADARAHLRPTAPVIELDPPAPPFADTAASIRHSETA